MKLFHCLSFYILFLLLSVYGQEELPSSGDGSGDEEGSGLDLKPLASGSGSGEGEAESTTTEVTETASGEEGSGDEDGEAAEEASGEEEIEGSVEGSTDDETCEESGSGEGINGCAKEESSGEEATEEEEEEEEASEGTCDVEGIDEKVSECLTDYGTRIIELEDTISSKEGGGLEDQIELVLVKKGVIDCENDTQCDDDKACLDSRLKRDRVLCEDPCDRNHCPIQHSECVVRSHKFSCECKEGFHGNGTERCVPDGFTAEENGKHYRIFDDSYVEFDNATEMCEELGARLPVLDSPETIKIVKKYLEESNFTVFEQWDRSSRRVWLGLILSPRSGLVWVDGARIMNYPVASRLFVWEARRALSAEASYADHTRHYGLYIDGDIAKLPGGGRRGAAVLCELIPPPENTESDTKSDYESPQRPDYYPGNQPNYYSQPPPQNNPYSNQQPPPNNPYAYGTQQQNPPSQPQRRPPGYPNYSL